MTSGTRRLLVLILLLGGATGIRPARSGTAAANGAGDVQVLNVTARPPRAGKGVVIDFNNFYGNVTGRPATPLRTVIIHWPHDMWWNGPRFPQCDPARLRTDGLSGCPEGSVFAHGTVEVDARPLIADPLRGTITAFVGTPAGGMSQVFLLEFDAVPPVILVGEFSPDPQGPPYGYMQTFDLSDVPPSRSRTSTWSTWRARSPCHRRAAGGSCPSRARRAAATTTGSTRARTSTHPAIR